jgi:hypothetical protein
MAPTRGPAVAFLFLAVRRIIKLIVLAIRSEDAKELELLVLRREIADLRRQVRRPAYEPADRAMLAVFTKVLPRSRWRKGVLGHASHFALLAPPPAEGASRRTRLVT